LTADAVRVAALSTNAAARRMRLHRHRRRKGLRSIRVLLYKNEIKTLVSKGYLEPDCTGQAAALEEAATMFISDALAPESQP
jgi:hypothetical protein